MENNILYDLSITGNQLIFFEMETNDTYNSAVVGKSISYCLNDECVFPSLKSK